MARHLRGSQLRNNENFVYLEGGNQKGSRVTCIDGSSCKLIFFQSYRDLWIPFIIFKASAQKKKPSKIWSLQMMLTVFKKMRLRS